MALRAPDADGRYHFEDVPAGDYELAFALEGFGGARRHVRVDPGEAAPVDPITF
ncbi:MAG: carboxypeptidase regulatory-like domain-containing protein [Myxococcales bacterium]|nr:carboxypeptidase regulatory-like domain-containing protein [Myxococcales bacterium]